MSERSARVAVGLVLGLQAGFLLLTIWMPGWDLIALDRKYNLPTFFQSILLAAAAVLALDIGRLEMGFLRGAGQTRWWAISWVGFTGLFAYMSLDEAILIHQRFNTDEMQAWLRATSPLQSTVVWQLIFLPGIVAAIGLLLASLGARARLSPRLAAWGAAGLGVWIACLVLEGTAKSFFIPRNLFRLEVIVKETMETLGMILWGWALWRYRTELCAWLGATAAAVPPRLAVPWRRVMTSTVMALVVPAAVVGGSIALNPQVRQKSIGDDHLRAGRVDEAARAYRAAVTLAPNWGRVWDRLGIAEFRRGDLEAADRAFSTAERLEPGSGTPTNHRGAVLARQGRYAEAAERFAEAAARAPQNADAHRNLGIALRHLGRQTEAEAAFRRAEALGLSRLGVTSMQVSLPADLPLVYLADPRLQTALDHTAAGRIDAAVLEYRRALSVPREAAAAHLGLANELLRWSVGRRVSRGRAPVGVLDADVDPVRPSVLFTQWVRRPDGRWDEIETTVEAAALEAPAAGGLDEAQAHYQRALALGAGAAAHLGLALLAREEGRAGEAASQLAAGRAVDPTVPLPDAPAARGPAAPFAPRGAALR